MKTDYTQQEAIAIVEQYYPQAKVASHNFNKRGRHEMILRLKSSFIVEGSNFRTLAFNPGEKTCLAEMTNEKLFLLKAQMEGLTVPKSGIELIAQERQEQIEKHGKTVEYDVENNSDKQLRWAAERLLASDEKALPDWQPAPGWDKELFDKMYEKPYKERLIIAGALIAAELDRLQAGETTE